MSARGSKIKPDIPALTGLRFFAAFFISFAHACDWCAQFQDWTAGASFGLVAMWGMPLFFVLSGFVIHYNYRALFSGKPFGTAVAEFAAARFARLAPLYFALLAVAIVADSFTLYLTHRPYLIDDAAFYFLTLTQSWVYVLWDGKLMTTSLFPLSWSVSTEVFFYVAYVFLASLLIRMVRARRLLLLSDHMGRADLPGNAKQS